MVSKVRTAVFQPAIKPVEGPVIDAAARDWSLVSLDGRHVSLGDFEGEVVLINFWATWCPPCRAEMPSLEKLYNGYGQKVSFLLVSNEDPDVIENYIDQKGYSFPVYISLGTPPQSMPVKSIPATFILNREGRQVYSKSGAFDWNNKKVRNFLDSLIAE